MMATIVKRGDVYRAQVIRKVGDKRICRSATFTLKSEARNWAAEIEAEILRRRRGLTTGIASNGGKITLHRAIQLYKEERIPGKRGERWEKVRCEKFMRDLPFVGKLVDGVTPTDISDWMRECLKSGLKPSTVNREITLLSSIFEFARKEKQWISTNPITLITRPPESKPRVRLVSQAERDAIIEELGYTPDTPPVTRMHYVALAFLFGIETGARAGEILKLRWEFVDYERMVARVTGGTKNGDYWRDLPLTPGAVRILKLCKQGQEQGRADLSPESKRCRGRPAAAARETSAEMCFPISSGYLDTIFRRARDRRGIKDLHFHDTRHQAATDMAQKLTPYQLARALGHRTLEHIMVYYNEETSEIARKLQ
jgi:integrase